MGVLKKYVRNRARPEGSIAKGYGNEEVIEFCVDFVPDLKPIGLPQSRHEGRLSGKGTIGRKSTICMDGHSMTEAHHTVLTNSSLVAPYFEKHKNILRSDNPFIDPQIVNSYVLEHHPDDVEDDLWRFIRKQELKSDILFPYHFG